MAEVLIVEDSVSEAALAAIAIALRRPGTSVREARDLQHALRLVATGRRPDLTILGWRALKETPGKLAGNGAQFVGFAANLSDAERCRALDAGVREIYERPQEWRLFCDMLEKLLNDCLGARARP